jgi:hypothetical protein
MAGLTTQTSAYPASISSTPITRLSSISNSTVIVISHKMERKLIHPDNIAYHRDMLNVPLDTSLVPKLTEILFSLISAERVTLVDAVAGLKKEVNYYKTLLLEEHEVEAKIGKTCN